MKFGFLELLPDERHLHIEQTAIQRNLSPVLVEKDFWVCWLLAVLFDSQFSSWLVFKGGTSLSKVFGVIDRFSEDIDLSVAPEFLRLPDPGTTRNQINKWMKSAEAACALAVEKELAPALESVVESVLGRRDGLWFDFMTDSTTHSPILLFNYPSTQPPGFEYLRRTVKLEFGSLTDQQPIGHYTVQPIMAEVIPTAFADWRCDVVTLELERSFWEKATILHTEYHRPDERPTPDRFSRHYADTAALARHPVAAQAIDKADLRDRVVDWKRRFFGGAWANYDLARPGTFRLVPPAKRLPGLRRDYQAMRDMYLTEPTDFEAILAELAELEQRINGP
jgi:hypothetical protein